jgi:hypothetical protein
MGRLRPSKAKQDGANGAVLLAPLPCKRKPAIGEKAGSPHGLSAILGRF